MEGVSCCCTAVAQINVNKVLNPVKCLADSIIFITLSNVKQKKQNKDMESISIILIVALMLYTAEKTKKYREL